MAAVDAAHAPIRVISPQRLCLPDQGGEVLVPPGIRLNVPQPLISHHGGSIHPVSIAGAGRHQAVGGKEHRCRDVFKFPLLVLPCRAEIPRQLWVPLQLRIAVSRQHLAVGVHPDPRAVGLLQQLVQILQIVAGHHDEGAAFHVRIHPGGNGAAEALRIGAIQQRHAAVIYPPELHQQRQPFLHAVGLPHRRQPLIKPAADLRVLIAEIHGVVGVGRHALQSEQQRGAQGNHIRLPPPEPAAILLRHRCLPLPQPSLHPLRKGADGAAVKVHVGEGGKQAVRQQTGDLPGVLSPFFADFRQTDEAAHKGILQIGGFRLLAAHPGADAAAAPRRLLALKAKHFRHD